MLYSEKLVSGEHDIMVIRTRGKCIMEYIVGSVKSRDKEKQRGIGFVNCFQYHLFYIDGIFFVNLSASSPTDNILDEPLRHEDVTALL
ncbi:hypothetical protein F2P81_016817 [Scophthalmus maximus]|uniref:Uncharacterized protein n=1 Tax=Scophthalmus maximus TaxID=52904 RepID=A0A6A4S4E9_SCOMX|nr:hypothetical protein F2P81_016817 [Scophthalmus maximus]